MIDIDTEIKNAISDLRLRFPWADSPTVEAVLRRLAQRVAASARGGAILELSTVHDVAAIYNISPRRVRALARRRQVGWQIPNTNVWLFRPEDIPALKPGRPGRPRKGRKRP
ncbi:MAG: hypothetical protein JRI59_06815 [Deltaproteobacteria bacterium]|nr:hypothetical protein [Deltaproteobacteria bacterium]